MVNRKVLLDTSAYSMLRLGHDQVREILENAEEVLISTIVIGELLYGYKNGSRYDSNKEILQQYLDTGVIIKPVSIETADIYSDLFIALKQSGRPIPTNDVWIAAQSVESGSVLLTFDKHFQYIQGLRLSLLKHAN